jgi:hypothetical protein
MITSSKILKYLVILIIKKIYFDFTRSTKDESYRHYSYERKFIYK